MLIANVVCMWPVLRGSKATGLAAVAGYSAESLLSPKFWVVVILLFGVFFAASRSSTILRALFFWIPTLAVSVIAFALLTAVTYLYMRR
jgi:hypothetical protein